MAKILFPTSSSPGRDPQEGGGGLVNAYAEQLSPGAKTQAVIRRAPGLVSFADNPDHTGWRGAALFGSNLFVAFSGVLVAIDANGVLTEIGALLGSGPVYFARNNKAPTPDYTVVTENGRFSFTAAASSIAELVDADLPQPSTQTFLDGYFFYGIADGRVFASGLNATTVNSLDSALAEYKADSNVRVVGYDGQLLIFAASSIEAWRNTGEPTGFPFTRVATIKGGLAGPSAIAGVEDDFDAGLLWVGADNAVHKLDGYVGTVVSPPELDVLIEAVADKTTLEASVYYVAGHPCWMLSCAAWTWVYDLRGGLWHQRKSYQQERSRITGGIKAFGKWLCGDTDSGNILQITETTQYETGDPLIMDVTSIQMEAFPRRMIVPRVRFDFVAGTGVATGVDPTETDPKVMISWSDDGGTTWGTPLVRGIGRQAMRDNQVNINACGRTGAKGRMWRLRISDGVYAALLGGDMDAV